MGFGEVLVLADQDNGLSPEGLAIHALVVPGMVLQPIGHALGFTDISHEPIRLRLIEALQQLHPRSPKLRKCRPHLLHLQFSERDRLDRRHGDLGNADAVRITIEQEDVDGARTHGNSLCICGHFGQK